MQCVLSPCLQSSYHSAALDPPSTKGNTVIVEWNAHLFSRDQQRYLFHSQANYLPDASQLEDDPLAVYLARMQQEGIDCAVLAHPEPYGDDHRLILDSLARKPGRFKGTCLFYPKDPEATRKLREPVQREPRIVALRIHTHRGKEHYLSSFADPHVEALWRACAELGSIVELHIGPNFAGQAGRQVARCASVPVVSDHLAEPAYGNAAEYTDILDLARFDNVYMNLSGLSHFSDDDPPYLNASVSRG